MPLYLLARVALAAPAAWAAAALWPLVPAANLFQPVADTAYPLLSTSALALAAWAARSHERPGRPALVGIGLAIASGMVMAFGMFFTLAFLPVGLIVALVVCFQPVGLVAVASTLDPGDRTWASSRSCSVDGP